MLGQGLPQLGELLLAFFLSAAVGLERELRGKSAGLRTASLVGVAAAVFTIVSKHGFNNVLQPGVVILDPSRVAAQVVSGIGFIGGGVIFMRRDLVRGLTTAASVWLTGAIGMACGAGLPLLAVATAGTHFAVMLGLPPLLGRLDRRPRPVAVRLRIGFDEAPGRLRAILLLCGEERFAVERVSVERDEAAAVVVQVRGRRAVLGLVARLGETDGVRRVEEV